MVDNEEVARRLREFAEAAAGRARGYMPWGARSHPRGSGPAKTPLEEIYEKCLAELTDDERNELDRMIEKMRRAL